jgi:hypothetical protein
MILYRMNERFAQTSFSIELTRDGSPTLRFSEGGESMHHSEGAASETLYIYKNVIKKAFSCLNQCNVMVVGLGLGYIELSWALELLKKDKKQSNEFVSNIISFEKDFELVNEFNNWLKGESKNKEIYDIIFKSLGGLDSDSHRIKSILIQNYKKYDFQNSLTTDTEPIMPFQLICFDAFSSKTNCNLWTEDFLDNFLRKFCANDCVFTTYACTGALKRALIQNGFKVIKRPGFVGKRDSTLALRGEFMTFENFFRIF